MRAFALGISVALAACGTGTAYRTTRIASAERTELLFGAQVSGAGTVGTPAVGGNGFAIPLPELSIAARRGLTDRLEAQLNATLLELGPVHIDSAELAAKARLAARGRWSLAVGAGVGYRFASVSKAILETVFVSAPLIGAVELGRHQLVLSADVGFQRLYESGSRPVNLPSIGESIGFLWQIGRSWALLPEIGGAWSPAGNYMTEHSRLFRLGVAVIWTR